MAKQIRITGVKEGVQNLKKYQIIKTQAVMDRLAKQAFKIELAAKEMCPVRYGRLRASITVNWAGGTADRAKIKAPVMAPQNPSKASDAVGRPPGAPKLSYAIGTNVKYGPAVEHGTSRMAARPYLHPAYFMHEGETILAIAKIMKVKVAL